MRPEVNMTALGAHVASARRQQHLRQADLAREVGIHAVTLSRIEHGKLPGVTVAVLARLAMRLDLSLDHLVQWQPGQSLRQPLDQAHLDTGGTARTVQDGVLRGLRASSASKRRDSMAVLRLAQEE
jgi:transcriptional regulator with XRE-family HTH domain